MVLYLSLLNFKFHLPLQPDEVENLFQKISQEQNGKLDVLVNNAYAAVELIMNQMGTWST